MKRDILISLAAVIVMMLAIACEIAFAQDPGADTEPELYELDLELGLEHSDNRGRTSPRGASETALVPRVILDLSRSGSRTDLRVAGDAEQRFPISGPFGNDFQANLAGRLNWHLIQQSLDWIVENVASGSPLDLAGLDTPENRQQTNVFSTGPRWVLWPAAPWSGLLDARYINSFAEDTDAFNSDRMMLAARVLRRLPGNRQLSAGAEVTEVDYRDDEFSVADYQRVDLVGRYTTKRAAFDLDLAAGRTTIDLERGDELENNLFRLRLAWNISDHHMLVASAGHELSDSVRQLAAGIEQLDLPVAGGRRLPIGNEFYVLDSLSLGWHFRYGRLDGSLTGGRHDYQFELDPLLDNEEQSIALGLGWQLTPTMELHGEAGLEKRDFRDENRRDEDSRASLFLVRRHNPRWSSRVGVIRHQRESNISGGDSRENIVALYLTYHAGY
jgi:hypothetical protein